MLLCIISTALANHHTPLQVGGTMFDENVVHYVPKLSFGIEKHPAYSGSGSLSLQMASSDSPYSRYCWIAFGRGSIATL